MNVQNFSKSFLVKWKIVNILEIGTHGLFELIEISYYLAFKKN